MKAHPFLLHDNPRITTTISETHVEGVAGVGTSGRSSSDPADPVGNRDDGPLSGFIVHQRDDETVSTLDFEKLLTLPQVEMAMVGACQSAPRDEILIYLRPGPHSGHSCPHQPASTPQTSQTIHLPGTSYPLTYCSRSRLTYATTGMQYSV